MVPNNRKWLIVNSIFGVIWFFILIITNRRIDLFAVTSCWILMSTVWLIVIGKGLKTVSDIVTLIRVLLMILVCVYAIGRDKVTTVMIIGVCIFAVLDKVDGVCARKWGGTPFGAVFDMESDQFAMVVLAQLNYVVGESSGFILLYAVLRNIHVLILESTGLAANDPKPVNGNNFRARVIFVAINSILLLKLCLGLSGTVGSSLMWIGILLLSFSLWSDYWYLLSRKFIHGTKPCS